MAKRTSTAPSSTRALKRNAFSGSSSSSALPDHCAAAEPARPSHRRARTKVFTEGIVSLLGGGFGGHPLEVGGQAALDWDRDDLGKFVRMPGAQRLLELGIALRGGLDEHRVLLVVLHRALPAVDRAAR